MSAQWSEETVETVAHAIHHPQSGRWERLTEWDQDFLRDRARVVLAVLAEAGLLVELGSETQTEWGYRSAIHGQQYPCEDEVHARRHVKWLAEQGQPVGDIMCRTIHTGPWLPDASSPSAAAPAGADSPGAAVGVPETVGGAPPAPPT